MLTLGQSRLHYAIKYYLFQQKKLVVAEENCVLKNGSCKCFSVS